MSNANAENKSSAPDGTNGRLLSRARRQAMSRGGKLGAGQVPRTKPAARSVMPTQVESAASLSPPDTGSSNTDSRAVRENSASNYQPSKPNAKNRLRGRAAAQARREILCQEGRGDNPACLPSGRRRAASAVPVKVEESSTSRGNLVTGTQVEGNQKVTGNEYGACKNVTGNEYTSAEQFESFCGGKPAPSPAKVGVSATQGGKRVSGTKVGRSTKVTGDEPGACLKLTGSQYYQPDQSGSVCQGSGIPHKVSVMSTVRERPVTGTDLAANTVVTGSEYGACKNVTGTEYAGLEQFQACNRAPVLTPEKVKVVRTWREQPVSGAMVEHNPKVTGDEYGGCQPISGTEYIGPDQYTDFCGNDSLAASRDRVATQRGAAGASMTGVRKGVEHKVTGRARGETQHLSGTPYSDDAQPMVSGSVGMGQHHLASGSADRKQITASRAATLEQREFSVTSPARMAQASQLNRVTGTAYGAQGRITGPVNLAAGLVSGTPEFRYKEDSVVAADKPANTVPGNRVTGEGREAGLQRR